MREPFGYVSSIDGIVLSVLERSLTAFKTHKSLQVTGVVPAEVQLTATPVHLNLPRTGDRRKISETKTKFPDSDCHNNVCPGCEVANSFPTTWNI
jgi:hypothetical protein